eukprot:scaffold248527_cov46-Cyclotella_meneghiniana.AAC.1
MSNESQHQSSGNDDFDKLFDNNDVRGESETKEDLPCDDDDKHKKDDEEVAENDNNKKDDEEVGKVDNDGRTYGLRGGGEVFEFHEILAMRKKSKTSSEYYVHWKEKYPGQHGDQLMTWVKAKDLPGDFVVEFKKTWKPMSKG